MRVNFRCSTCNGSTLECVETGVLVYTSVLSVADDGFMDFGSSEVNYGSGTIDRFQCASCGMVIIKTSDPTELLDYLIRYDMVEPE